MISVQGVYDGKVIRPLEKIFVRPNVKVIITFLEEEELITDHADRTDELKETDILAQSSEFAKLIKKSLEDIRLSKVAPWKEVWNEL